MNKASKRLLWIKAFKYKIKQLRSQGKIMKYLGFPNITQRYPEVNGVQRPNGFGHQFLEELEADTQKMRPRGLKKEVGRPAQPVFEAVSPPL